MVGNTSRVGTSSADVVVRHEVVAAATAHTKLKTASSTDHVEDLHVLKRAVVWVLASPSVCQHRAARQAAVDGLQRCEQFAERQGQRAGQHDHQQHRRDRSCERVR